MKKQKYVYNPETLQFEKAVPNTKRIILKTILASVAIVVFGIAFSSIWQSYFPSPTEKRLKNELASLEYDYNQINQRLNKYTKVLDNIKQRDDGIYKMVLGISPLDQNIWEGGIGGHDFNPSKSIYADQDLINDTKQKVNKLERQIVLFSKALDEVEKLAKEKSDRLESIPSIKPVREDKLARNIQLLSGFGMRMHPIHKIMKMHAGLDFTCPKGTKVIATGKGKIIKIENKAHGYGKNILIDHGYGYKTRYAHLSKVDVRVGQSVEKGEVIGEVGSTGTSTSDHLHYEVLVNDRQVDPIEFCLDGLTPDEYLTLVQNANQSVQSFD